MSSEIPLEARQWAAFAHLMGLTVLVGIPFGNIIGPLAVWMFKRNEFAFVDVHGKEALNFQISMTLYALIGVALLVTIVGLPLGLLLLLLVALGGLILTIVAAIKANEGQVYRYPFTLRFV